MQSGMKKETENSRRFLEFKLEFFRECKEWLTVGRSEVSSNIASGEVSEIEIDSHGFTAPLDFSS